VVQHLTNLSDEESVAKDARDIYRDAVFVVTKAIGQEIKDGKLVMHPQVWRYLEKQGFLPPADREAEGNT